MLFRSFINATTMLSVIRDENEVDGDVFFTEYRSNRLNRFLGSCSARLRQAAKMDWMRQRAQNRTLMKIRFVHFEP